MNPSIRREDVMTTQKFRFSLASAAFWIAAVSIGFGLIRLGASRGLPMVFEVFALLGFFLLGGCLGAPLGHYADGAKGARWGGVIGGVTLAVVGIIWLILRHELRPG
jgi:hypothetical protein